MIIADYSDYRPTNCVLGSLGYTIHGQILLLETIGTLNDWIPILIPMNSTFLLRIYANCAISDIRPSVTWRGRDAILLTKTLQLFTGSFISEKGRKSSRYALSIPYQHYVVRMTYISKSIFAKSSELCIYVTAEPLYSYLLHLIIRLQAKFLFKLVPYIRVMFII